jgi:hypothetical protein
MLSQTILIVVLGVVLVLLIVARVALNGQITRARARAREQERVWRESQAADEERTQQGGDG